jgi:hypothetical protein
LLTDALILREDFDSEKGVAAAEKGKVEASKTDLTKGDSSTEPYESKTTALTRKCLENLKAAMRCDLPVFRGGWPVPVCVAPCIAITEAAPLVAVFDEWEPPTGSSTGAHRSFVTAIKAGPG